MSEENQNQRAERPLFRVSFARIIGKDRNGRDELGRPKEIGAIWQRKNGKQGGILNLDIIPVELTQRQGVLFVLPVEDPSKEGGAQ